MSFSDISLDEYRRRLLGATAYLLSGVAACALAASSAYGGDTTPTGAALFPVATPLAEPVAQKRDTVRVLSFNTYREYFNGARGDASNMSNFLINGDYDIIALSELCYISDCRYVDDIQTILQDAGKGEFSGTRSGEDGVVSRLPGVGGEYKWGNYFSGQVSYFTADAVEGVPKTTFVSAHFDWRDSPYDYRIYEATKLNQWAKEHTSPIVLTGDFNAGDVSERGLHTAEQQSYLVARTILDSSSSSLWRSMAKEYMPGGESAYEAYRAAMSTTDANGVVHYRNVLQAYFDANRAEYPDLTSISQMSWRQWEEIIAKDMASKGITFEDETYAIKSNTPQTMNVLKKQFMMLTSDATREKFEPHGGRNGIQTWPITDQNTSTGWDYAKIDHFMASRPFGKWWEVVDDPDDKYLGTLKETAYANDGVTPISDHELVAHELRWIGPILSDYAGDATKKTVTWGADANTFQESGGVFYLTRNNMRQDMYLGQIADDNGEPVFVRPEASQLTDEQLGTLLAQSVYDLHDPASYRAKLANYVDPGQVNAYNDYLAKLSNKESGGYFRTVIQNYLDSNPGEFPGITTVSAMSWEQWGYVLLKHVSNEVSFSNVDLNVTDRRAELEKALGLDDLATRTALAAQYGLDFDNDPNAVLKIPLDCGNAAIMSLAGVADYCIDDHSFIGETLITDAGTVIVDEDAALGGSAAALRLDDGTLRIAGTQMDALLRDVVLEGEKGGTIEVAEAANLVTAPGEFSGTGALAKTGRGAMNLTGENTYTGKTTVAEGALFVNGSIAASALTSVEDGALLGGTGKVGNLEAKSGATIAPGNGTIGTLNVEGDLTFRQGSIYQVEVDADGNSDLIAVTGKTVIDGGSVMSLAAGGQYKPQTDYTILEATGGVEGAFDAVTSNFAFLDPTLAYGGSDIKLTLTRNDTAFDRLGRSFNQRSAASGAESLGQGAALYDAIVLLDEAGAASAFAQIGGEAHASTWGSLIDNSRFLRDAVGERLHGIAGEETGGGVSILGYTRHGLEPAPADTDRFVFWSKSFGSWADRSGNGNARGLSGNVGGVLAGLDAAVTDHWRLGVSAGYSRNSVSLDGLSQSASSDDIHIGLYAGTDFGPLGIRFGAAHSWNNIESTRHVSFAGLRETLTADYYASTTQVFGEGSYRFDIGNGSLSPFANLSYVRFSHDGFRERGGAAALTGAKSDLDAFFTTLGLRGASELQLGATTATLNGMLGWRHVAGDSAPQSTLAFAGGDSFTVKGATIAKDTALVEAGLDFAVAPNASIGVSYSGQFGSGISDNGVNGHFRLKF